MRATNSFRFHTGSIKRMIRDDWGPSIEWSFDSILVRLKGRTPGGSAGDACFDSILVRLKVDGREVGKIQGRNMFRFHTGSIKSRRLLTVRVTKKFRFHTGSIKSHAEWRYSFSRGLFRFHTGSIKRYTQSIFNLLCVQVSIPYWFD